MIAKLSGVIDSLGEDRIIIDVGGVGYLVFCSARTLRAMPPAGEAVTLRIETHVREDHIHLYGFVDGIERDWFLMLQSVQGVGTRVALGILSVLSPGDLAPAIVTQDRATLGRANGVGPKLAARIVNELKDKVANLAVFPAAAVAGLDHDSTAGDAISALVNLGYRRADAVTAVVVVTGRSEGEPVVADLVRDSLRELSR